MAKPKSLHVIIGEQHILTFNQIEHGGNTGPIYADALEHNIINLKYHTNEQKEAFVQGISAVLTNREKFLVLDDKQAEGLKDYVKHWHELEAPAN